MDMEAENEAVCTTATSALGLSSTVRAEGPAAHTTAATDGSSVMQKPVIEAESTRLRCLCQTTGGQTGRTTKRHLRRFLPQSLPSPASKLTTAAMKLLWEQTWPKLMSHQQQARLRPTQHPVIPTAHAGKRSCSSTQSWPWLTVHSHRQQAGHALNLTAVTPKTHLLMQASAAALGNRAGLGWRAVATRTGTCPSRASTAQARGLGLGSAVKLAAPIVPPAHRRASGHGWHHASE